MLLQAFGMQSGTKLTSVLIFSPKSGRLRESDRSPTALLSTFKYRDTRLLPLFSHYSENNGHKYNPKYKLYYRTSSWLRLASIATSINSRMVNDHSDARQHKYSSGWVLLSHTSLLAFYNMRSSQSSE